MLIKPISELSAKETALLIDRSSGLSDVAASVNAILTDVKENGDAALRKYTQQFDRAAIDEIEVSHKEIHEALFSLDKNVILYLKKAAGNIRAFHEAQVTKDWIKEFPGYQARAAHYSAWNGRRLCPRRPGFVSQHCPDDSHTGKSGWRK